MTLHRYVRSSRRAHLSIKLSRKEYGICLNSEGILDTVSRWLKVTCSLIKCHSILIWLRGMTYEMELIFPVWLSYWSCWFHNLVFWPCFCPLFRENIQGKFHRLQNSPILPCLAFLPYRKFWYMGKSESAPHEKSAFYAFLSSLARHCCWSTESISSLSTKSIYCLIKKCLNIKLPNETCKL